MRRPSIDGGFWFSFGLNLVLNYEGAIAFALALVAHFVFDIPIWIAWLILVFWVGGIFLVTLVLSFLMRNGSSNPSGTGSAGAGTVRFSSRGDGQKFKQDNDENSDV